MGASPRNSEHLIRLAGVVAACLIGFVLLRRAVIPEAFGQLGHYRPAALQDNEGRPLSYAGQAECAVCHEAENKDRVSGRHARIACEACHGPQAQHAADPEKRPAKADVVALCTNCHAKDAAKPIFLPQVSIKDHYPGACNDCHQPHKPKM
jgi:hypothetical protein